MYVKEKKSTVFGFGEINGEPIVAFDGDFNYPTNTKLETLKLVTYEDTVTHNELYVYKNKLCTKNELIVQYLKEFYKIKD